MSTMARQPLLTPPTCLRPGVHVVRRDDEHLQVGVDPPARVIVPDHPDVVSLLDALVAGETAPAMTDRSRRVLRQLTEAGLLSAGPPATVEGAVALVPHGLDLAPLRSLLAAVGVGVLARGADAAARAAALHVVASAAPLSRDVLDRWSRDGIAHLVLAGTGGPGSLRLGPLVVPGRTACLRCVDAHEAVLDPRRPLVVGQLADRPVAPLPLPLVSLGLAWAAREAASYLSGGHPATWSATIDLDDAVPTRRAWERHPHCGCAWHELG